MQEIECGCSVAKIQVILNPVLETKLFEIKMNNLVMIWTLLFIRHFENKINNP
jgi:hypothetical protein